MPKKSFVKAHMERQGLKLYHLAETIGRTPAYIYRALDPDDPICLKPAEIDLIVTAHKVPRSYLI